MESELQTVFQTFFMSLFRFPFQVGQESHFQDQGKAVKNAKKLQ